jgi:hypothetical protein
MAYYDTNGSMFINPADDFETDHFGIMEMECDFDFDGSIDLCEIETCMVTVENIWRDTYRPDYGYVYCTCTPVCECEGAKNCHDI